MNIYLPSFLYCKIYIINDAVNSNDRMFTCSVATLCYIYIINEAILGDPGAVSRVDKLFVVKVYCKIETSSSRC